MSIEVVHLVATAFMAGLIVFVQIVHYPLMGLVGENVALICAGLAGAHQVRRMVFGGATLRKNPSLVSILQGITTALGAEVTFLPDGEFAGALGALLLAETSS